MLSLAIVLSIFVAVAIGYKMKINVGVLGIAFSYIFGCFIMGMKTGKVIGLWPLGLFFFIMMSSFFYGIAVTNGTLALFSEHMIYRFRRHPWFVPVMMWLACFIVSGLGPGPTTVFAFMPAIILATAERINMSKLVAAVIIVGGGVAGGYPPISLCYAVVNNCLSAAGFPEAQIPALLNSIALNVIIAQVLIFITIYLLCKTWQAKLPEDLAKPAAFNAQQKKTLWLIGFGMFVMVLFPFLKVVMPQSAFVKTVAGTLNPSLVFTVLLVIALMFKLGDQKKAMAFIPWGTIILVCGTGMLVSVAKAAGAIDYLSKWLGTNMSPLATKVLVALISGGMSFFSSTIGVVAPTLIPLIPGISQATSIAAASLISAIMFGGHVAGVSPFSTGGAMVMAGESDEEKKNTLFIRLMLLSVGSMCFASLLTVVGVFG